MAARGSIAKEEVAKKIIDFFGQDKAFVYDKKIYINTTENGEKVQVALTLTCPKNLVGEVKSVPDSAFAGGSAFDLGVATAAPEPFQPAEISSEERETVAELMRRLGL